MYSLPSLALRPLLRQRAVVLEDDRLSDTCPRHELSTSIEPVPARRRFTLVELLVVVAIIAVLASILLPALRHGLERGRSARCKSNLSQLAVAQYMYADDNTGWIWGTGGGQWFGTSQPNVYKGRILFTYMGFQSSKDMLNTFVCPTQNKFRYAMSYGTREAVRIDTTPNLEHKWLHGDSNNADACIPTFEAMPPEPAQVWYGHNLRANVVLGDGHIETRTPRQIPFNRSYLFPNWVESGTESMNVFWYKWSK